MTKVINPAGLTQAAKTYDPLFRVLPFYSLSVVASALNLNIMEVSDEHVIVNKRRKAGGTGPYKSGMEITYQEEISKFYESNLKPELVVYKIKDNILNYQEKKMLVQAGRTLDLKKKKHPLEFDIIKDIITSHGEDVVFSLFYAQRDENTFSPLTSFTGFFPALDLLTTAGYIAAGQKNVHTTGEIKKPTTETDTTAYDQLVDFVASAHPLLRSGASGTPDLVLSESTLIAARSALRNKLKALEYPTMDKLKTYLREDANCPSLDFVTHEALGTGGKLILQKKGNMDIGFNTGKANQFVQVRDIFEDPNEVQFWLEAAYGVRIRDVHQKVFRTNEQTNTAIDGLAGDY